MVRTGFRRMLKSLTSVENDHAAEAMSLDNIPADRILGTATVKQVLIRPPAAQSKLGVVQKKITIIPGMGASEDAHYSPYMASGGHFRDVPHGTVMPNLHQLTMLSEEELAIIASGLELPEVKAEWLSANIVISGMAQMTRNLKIGTWIWFVKAHRTPVILRVEGVCRPCGVAGKNIQDANPDHPELTRQFASKAGPAWNNRGLYLSGMIGGNIAPGFTMTAIKADMVE